jgi:hypothetical protein
MKPQNATFFCPCDLVRGALQGEADLGVQQKPWHHLRATSARPASQILCLFLPELTCPQALPRVQEPTLQQCFNLNSVLHQRVQDLRFRELFYEFSAGYFTTFIWKLCK